MCDTTSHWARGVNYSILSLSLCTSACLSVRPQCQSLTGPVSISSVVGGHFLRPICYPSRLFPPDCPMSICCSLCNVYQSFRLRCPSPCLASVSLCICLKWLFASELPAASVHTRYTTIDQSLSLSLSLARSRCLSTPAPVMVSDTLFTFQIPLAPLSRTTNRLWRHH